MYRKISWHLFSFIPFQVVKPVVFVVKQQNQMLIVEN
jgi:hypothetical protein